LEIQDSRATRAGLPKPSLSPHRRALLGGGLVALAGGWGVWSLAQPVAAQPGLELLEPIYAASVTARGLTVRMASAATAKSDIAFYVQRSLFGASIAIGRRPASRRQPRIPPPGHADLTFTYAELGLDSGALLTVLNPLVPEPKAVPGPVRKSRPRA
jgi:hypothetical protein